MHYIVHLFRVFHVDAQLAGPPFSEAAGRALPRGRRARRRPVNARVLRVRLERHPASPICAAVDLAAAMLIEAESCRARTSTASGACDGFGGGIVPDGRLDEGRELRQGAAGRGLDFSDATADGARFNRGGPARSPLRSSVAARGNVHPRLPRASRRFVGADVTRRADLDGAILAGAALSATPSPTTWISRAVRRLSRLGPRRGLAERIRDWLDLTAD